MMEMDFVAGSINFCKTTLCIVVMLCFLLTIIFQLVTIIISLYIAFKIIIKAKNRTYSITHFCLVNDVNKISKLRGTWSSKRFVSFIIGMCPIRQQKAALK